MGVGVVREARGHDCAPVMSLAQPTAPSRDLLSAVLAGHLVLHVDLRAARPFRLLQLGVVPAGVCLFEGGWGQGCGPLCV